MPTWKRFVSTFAVAAVVCVVASSAWADPIVYSFSGRVTSEKVGLGFSGPFSIGDSILGYFTVDPNAIHTDFSTGAPAAGYSSFSQPIGFQFQSGYSLLGNASVMVVDSVFGSNYNVSAQSRGPSQYESLSGQPVAANAYVPLRLHLGFGWLGGSHNPDLSSAPANLGEFPLTSWDLAFTNGTVESYLVGSIDSLKEVPTAVTPEPASIAMMGGGLAAMIAAFRRRRSRI